MSERAMADFDATDMMILRALAEDGRMSDVTLGERVNLSSTAAARRRKMLEEARAITGYNAALDLPMLGLGIVVLVSIELNSQAETALEEFERAVVACPSVTQCHFVSGDTDFVMTVHVGSFADFDRIYRSELAMLPHVARIRSSFVMRSITQRGVPPVVYQNGKGGDTRNGTGTGTIKG